MGKNFPIQNDAMNLQKTCCAGTESDAVPADSLHFQIRVKTVLRVRKGMVKCVSDNLRLMKYLEVQRSSL